MAAAEARSAIAQRRRRGVGKPRRSDGEGGVPNSLVLQAHQWFMFMYAAPLGRRGRACRPAVAAVALPSASGARPSRKGTMGGEMASSTPGAKVVRRSWRQRSRCTSPHARRTSSPVGRVAYAAARDGERWGEMGRDGEGRLRGRRRREEGRGVWCVSCAAAAARGGEGGVMCVCARARVCARAALVSCGGFAPRERFGASRRHSEASLRHLCGISEASLRHLCGISAASLRHLCGIAPSRGRGPSRPAGGGPPRGSGAS